MSRRASLVILLVLGFGLYAADLEVVSRTVDDGQGLFLSGGIDDPVDGASAPVTPKHSPVPALPAWELEREELSFPLVSPDDAFRPIVFGPGSHLGRAPPLA
jgi:hypothetical protein